jgi:hypothetical protein
MILQALTVTTLEFIYAEVDKEDFGLNQITTSLSWTSRHESKGQLPAGVVHLR